MGQCRGDGEVLTLLFESLVGSGSSSSDFRQIMATEIKYYESKCVNMELATVSVSEIGPGLQALAGRPPDAAS